MPISTSYDDHSAVLPIVINTRPPERATPLSIHLQTAGFQVVDIPMLTLQARTVTAKETDNMRQWLSGHYQALVVVSPTAADAGLALWHKLVEDEQATVAKNHQTEQSLVPIVAVGAATASVLRAAQNQASDCPWATVSVANYAVLTPIIANNEGMLAMPEIARLQAGDKALIWRGLGGRRLLVNDLRARGVQVDSIAWYERVMPPLAASNYQQWLQDYTASQQTVAGKDLAFVSKPVLSPLVMPKPVVIISSGTAFEHWASVVVQAELKSEAESITNNAPKLTDFSYIVLGVRLAEMLAKQHLEYGQVEDLDPETILTAVHQSLSKSAN